MSNSVEDLQMLRLIKAFRKISDQDVRHGRAVRGGAGGEATGKVAARAWATGALAR